VRLHASPVRPLSLVGWDGFVEDMERTEGALAAEPKDAAIRRSHVHSSR